ncbi:MAG: serine hydrolase [Solirubrobacterales bacterium]
MTSVLLLAFVAGLFAPPGAGAGTHGPRSGWHPHLGVARRYARQRAGRVAFAVIDQRGRMEGFHAAETAPAASVFKVMLLVAYLRMRHGRVLSGGDKALLGPMIRRSDSVAATQVRDIVGRRRIERVARIAGMRDFSYRAIWGLSRTSPRDQVRLMYHLPSYIPGKHRAYALHLLSHIVHSQRWGIGRVAPSGWKLFFKGGWGSGSGRVDHQVALLTRNGDHVAVAIFTQFDPDHAYGERTERGVAARLLGGLGNSSSSARRPLAITG